MDITPSIPADRQVIQSYGVAGFRINGQAFYGPVIVLPDRVIPWQVSDPASLRAEDFAPLAGNEPPVEVVLLGCGARGMLFPPKLRQELRPAGYSVDTMDTGAACRTYNVMLSEGRPVAAALFPG